MTPSICGTFLTDKRSLVAFTWTITTVLTLVAFVLATVMMVHVHTHYKRLERYYQEQWEYSHQYNNNDEDREGEEGEKEGSADREIEQYLQLAAMSSNSMTFTALYTMIIAIGLSMYGSTAIVGFTSLRGDYIAPCFSSSGSSNLRLGIFGGAIVFFANLLLVCAVIFGEVRVEDWDDRRDQEEMEPYEIERIATVLAVTCMFLAALYIIFALLLFLYFGNEELCSDIEEEPVGTKPLASISNDPRRENFITMGTTS